MTIERHRLEIGDRTVWLLEGPAGWGECSPLPGYPCDHDAAHRAAVEAAVEGWPVARRTTVPVNALVDRLPIDPSCLAAYPCVKVKVGRPDLRADVEVVEHVRGLLIGDHVALRLDANGAWTEDAAVGAIRELARFDLELVEQPVSTIEELARVRRSVEVPIAADECIRSVDDAVDLERHAAADAVVLKVQPLGGVRATLRVAEAAGVPAVVTSMRETSIGIAAGLALAAALPELRFACGLAARLEGGDVVRDPLVPEGGELCVRTVAPDAELLARYEVSS